MFIRTVHEWCELLPNKLAEQPGSFAQEFRANFFYIRWKKKKTKLTAAVALFSHAILFWSFLVRCHSLLDAIYWEIDSSSIKISKHLATKAQIRMMYFSLRKEAPADAAYLIQLLHRMCTHRCDDGSINSICFYKLCSLHCCQDSTTTTTATISTSYTVNLYSPIYVAS